MALLALVLCGLDNGAAAQHPPIEDVTDGSTLYAVLCALCHGDRGEGYVVERAPALGNQDFLTTVSDEFLYAAIARGRPGTLMSPWSAGLEGPLTDPQIQAVVDFIRSWQAGPSVEIPEGRIDGSPERGRDVFRARCVECHGQDGDGKSAPSLNNPEFLGVARDAFIRYTIAHGRAGTAMAPYEGELSPQEIDDLVALIRSWSSRPHPRRP